MIYSIIFFIVGLLVGWNLFPQPVFVKNLWDKIKAKLTKKDTKTV